MTSLAPGLLAAAPPLADPNFERSVVLLAAHGVEGAFGWVINGAELMSLSELFENAKIPRPAAPMAGVVRAGGPVSREQVWLIYKTEERLPGVEGQFEVCPGITASAAREVLEAIAASEAPPSLMAVAGYAGWAASQLEAEIRAGAWLPADASADLVFGQPLSELWHRVYERIGATPLAFTSRIVGSA